MALGFDSDKKIIEQLLERGYLPPDSLDGFKGSALDLVQQRRITEDQYLEVYSDMLGLPYIDLNEPNVVHLATVRKLPEGVCRRFKMAAVGISNGIVYVAMVNPRDIVALDTAKQVLSGLRVQPLVALESAVMKAIDAAYASDAGTLGSILGGQSDDDNCEGADIPSDYYAKQRRSPTVSADTPVVAKATAEPAVAVPVDVFAAFPFPSVGAPLNLSEGETLKRKTTVRYYKQMNPLKNYPLLVLLTKEQVQKAVLKDVEQSTGAGVAVREANPFVTIVPRFPGCLVVPDRLEVNVTSDSTEAHFFVTPFAATEIKHARVELWYEGRCIDTVSTPTKVTSQLVARLLAFVGVMHPLIFGMLEGFGFDPRKQLDGNAFLVQITNQLFGGSVMQFGIVAATAIGLVALLFYWLNKPRQGDPVVQFLTWQAAKQ